MTTAPTAASPAPMPSPASGRLPSTPQPQACAQMSPIGNSRTPSARQREQDEPAAVGRVHASEGFRPGGLRLERRHDAVEAKHRATYHSVPPRLPFPQGLPPHPSPTDFEDAGRDEEGDDDRVRRRGVHDVVARGGAVPLVFCGVACCGCAAEAQEAHAKRADGRACRACAVREDK